MEAENSKIMEMLTAMAKKLKKLDHIDAHLHAVDQEIKELKHSLTFLHDTMTEIKNYGSKIMEMLTAMAKKLKKLDHIDAHLHAVDQEIKELKHSLTFLHDTMTEIKNKQDAQEVQLNKLKKEVAEVKGVTTKLEREIVDIRARSMRSNLIFYNVPEEAHENLAQVVQSVITKMGIEDGKGIEMERIHRMGKQSRPSPSYGTRVQETSQTSRPRPIV